MVVGDPGGGVGGGVGFRIRGFASRGCVSMAEGLGTCLWRFRLSDLSSLHDPHTIPYRFRLVGVGEASFISLAAPFIDDYAPPGRTTRWLALFYMCIPTGYAVGYIFGGLVAGAASWRMAFWAEGLLMLPFALFGFVADALPSKGGGDGGVWVILEEGGEKGRGGCCGDGICWT